MLGSSSTTSSRASVVRWGCRVPVPPGALLGVICRSVLAWDVVLMP
jgi:hypothetical protein